MVIRICILKKLFPISFQHFEANLHNFESSVSFMEDNLRDLDLLIRSKKHLNENLETVEVMCLNSCH